MDAPRTLCDAGSCSCRTRLAGRMERGRISRTRAERARRSYFTAASWIRCLTCVSPHRPSVARRGVPCHLRRPPRPRSQRQAARSGGLCDAASVGDTVAVLDELGIERAHFVGKSWGGRLGFGIGEHAPDRVLSLVIGGNQPYAWPDSPLVGVVTEALRVAREEGTVGPLVRAFEDFWGVAFPDAQRARWLGNDPAALAAAWSAALAEGPISQDLGRWRMPCLIFIGDVGVTLPRWRPPGGGGDPERGAARARRGRPLRRAHEPARSRSGRCAASAAALISASTKPGLLAIDSHQISTTNHRLLAPRHG